MRTTGGVFSPKLHGFVCWRDSWKPDATVIHFKCGDTCDHHGTYDQGKFTVFKHAPLAIKNGAYMGYKSSMHRYYKSPSTWCATSSRLTDASFTMPMCPAPRQPRRAPFFPLDKPSAAVYGGWEEVRGRPGRGRPGELVRIPTELVVRSCSKNARVGAVSRGGAPGGRRSAAGRGRASL